MMMRLDPRWFAHSSNLTDSSNLTGRARGGGPQLAESHLTRTPFRKTLGHIFALIMPPVYCGYGTRGTMRRLHETRLGSSAQAVAPGSVEQDVRGPSSGGRDRR